MFRCWWLFTIVAFSVSSASAQLSVPYIAGYLVEVNLRDDSTLIVTETIVVNFGQVLRHGIYRKVPFRYKRRVKGVPTTYNLHIKLLSVTDEHRNSYPVKSWREGDYLFWRIGDPDRYVSGWKTYRIAYKVNRAVNSFPDHDELYWNATGNEWEWDIVRVHCIVNLPEGLDERKVKATFHTGYFGSRERKGKMWFERESLHFETGHLRRGEGLTIVVGLPKGVLKIPSPAKTAFWFVVDNWALIAAFLIPLSTFAVMFSLYWKHGRDPIWRQSIAAQYRPPDDLTPAEVGVLMDERADNIDITATVIDLAVKGYLKIREVESERLLFLKRTDYEFVFLRDGSELKKHERTVLNGLKEHARPTANPNSVRLSDLKERFYPHLKQAKSDLYETLARNRYFAGNPAEVRESYFALGVVVGATLLMVGLFLVNTDTASGLALVISGLITGLAIAGFAFAMPRKTEKGAKALWHILGFREFIRRVEKDRLERMLQEDPNLFDRVLPYALVFGVADEWAEKFEGLLAEPPSWYESDRWTPMTFNTSVFVHSLGDSVSSMNSVLPSSPSRSSGTGGGKSGFGGGFSGGGFGGGGGGGW
ncbi:MAG: DUF2207 domain-containing protein [Candidatus Fervidibacter sp.]|uniref:DUF2207 domain-containing protein n=1 Tax=Candidatus Fervidibacter sp. TaxID=3100871 RepID=UPI0040495956